MAERLATLAMGARFELVLEGRDPTHARAAGEAALEEIERCDARWSLFRSDSLVARVNREAAWRAVSLDPETFELLEACAALREATQGAFDVALGARMRELGFRGAVDGLATSTAGPRGERADPKQPPFELDARARTIRFTRPSVALDLGAVGKGEALDRALDVLREAGIERALAHGGTSSVAALGSPPERDNWNVELEGFGPTHAVALRGRALSVSAPHARTLGHGAQRLGHVLDPLGGAALAPGLRVAALAPTGRVAEAWSTAALVLLARGVDPRACAAASVELLVALASPERIPVGAAAPIP